MVGRLRRQGHTPLASRPSWTDNQDERSYIHGRREYAGVPLDERGTFGLALSGGGIRSSAFAFGALQGLWQFGLLPFVDYLSMVSGGGFIGACWLVHGETLFTPPATGHGANALSTFLRRNASYLAPLGVLSSDGIAMLSAYLYGFLLNLIQLFGVFGFCVSLLHFGAHSERFYALLERYVGLGTVAAFVLTLAFGIAAWGRRPSDDQPDPELAAEFVERDRDVRRLQRVGLAISIALSIVTLGLWTYDDFARKPLHDLLLHDLLQSVPAAESLPEQLTILVARVRGHWLLWGPLVLPIANASLLWSAMRWIAKQGTKRARYLSLAGQVLAMLLFVSSGWMVSLLDEFAVEVFAFPAWVPFAFWSALLLLASFIRKWFTPTAGSLHHFYRDRLTDTFLAPLDLQGEAMPSRAQLLSSFARAGSLPYPIVNATVNLPNSKTRRGGRLRIDLFELTPRQCGSAATGFRPTSEWEGGSVSLARAIAASGAALDPRMGRYTQPLLSFLISFFNLRLGTAVVNPNSQGWKKQYSPLFPIDWRLAELGEDSPYCYLSDGGHFENLGLLSLLRRRCQYIVVIDAEEDPKRVCEGLGRAILLARNEDGTTIDIDLTDLECDDHGVSKSPCTVGKICYPGDVKPGVLVYVKASILGNENPHVRHFHRVTPEFPHSPTINQFFDEDQFEAYRELGRQSVLTVLGRVGTADQFCQRRNDPQLLADTFNALKSAWQVRPSTPLETFLRTTDRFIDLEKILLQSPAGKEYREALFPNADVSQHDLHLTLVQMQLMEQVYLACRLDEYHAHPENSGWMELFRAYAKSPTFVRVWEKCSRIYGRGFCEFAGRHLKLPLPLTYRDAPRIAPPEGHEKSQAAARVLGGKL